MAPFLEDFFTDLSADESCCASAGLAARTAAAVKKSETMNGMSHIVGRVSRSSDPQPPATRHFRARTSRWLVGKRPLC